MDKITLVVEAARLAGKAQGLGYCTKGFVAVDAGDVLVVFKGMELPNNDAMAQEISKAFNEGFEAARES